MGADFWTISSSIATTLGFVIVSVSALAALYQLREATRARALDSFTRALDELSTDEAAAARRYVYNHQLPAPESIAPDSELFALLYRVYLPFDKVGLMVHQRLLPENLVIEMYGESIIITWRKLKPIILAERRRTGRVRYQMYYEALYNRSVAYLKRCYPAQYQAIQQKYPEGAA